MPGLGNFVGEFLILTGTFVVAPWVSVVASTGLIFAVVYALIMVQRALQGPMHGAVANAALAFVDLTKRELAMMFALIALLVGLGLYPQPVIDAARAPVQAFDAMYSFAGRRACRFGSRAVNEQIMALMPLLVTTATVVVVDVRRLRCDAATA